MFACFLRVKINTEPQFWCFRYLRKISIIKTQQSLHVFNIAIFTVFIGGRISTNQTFLREVLPPCGFLGRTKMTKTLM